MTTGDMPANPTARHSERSEAEPRNLVVGGAAHTEMTRYPDGAPSDPAAPAEGAYDCAVARVERDGLGRLVVHLKDGRRIADARLARCFPWTMPEGYVSVRDAEGKEVALLDTLAALDAVSRQVVQEELRDKVFHPKIRRVLRHRREFDITSMTVETDRGEATFQFMGREDVRLLSPVRALFRDVDGNTYEVEDLTKLDPASRKHLRLYF